MRVLHCFMFSNAAMKSLTALVLLSSETPNNVTVCGLALAPGGGLNASLKSEMTTLLGGMNFRRYPEIMGRLCCRYSSVSAGMCLVSGLVCVRNSRSNASLHQIVRFSGALYNASI